MTEKAKPKTGIVRIISGSILLAWALLALVRTPFVGDGLIGAIIAVLVLVGFGVLFLATGITQRRKYLSGT